MRSLALAAALAAAAAPALAAPSARLSVVGEAFVLSLPDGRRLTSADLVGAELTTEEGEVIRIDAAAAARERPSLTLLTLSVRRPDGGWAPACDPDAYGRQAGFPVAGRWEGQHYVKDPKRWFLTCTSGSQAKCILWGYDPWSNGPHGEDLAPWYRACQYTVRANYDGRGEAHTRNGTEIDVADTLGIARHDSLADPAFGFEAGWGERGAVCVARTRWPDLLSRETLVKAAPRLDGPCDEAAARKRGALIFTRVKLAAPVPSAAQPAP